MLKISLYHSRSFGFSLPLLNPKLELFIYAIRLSSDGYIYVLFDNFRLKRKIGGKHPYLGCLSPIHFD